MRRRSFLKGMAAATALQSIGPTRAGITTGFRRVRPSDPAWPSAARWDALRKAVDGKLIKVEPLFGPCSNSQAPSCQDVLQNIRNPFFIGDQPGGTQVSGWFNAWTPGASAYAVKAHATSDVVAAVNFARDNDLRLVVKGTGHSYLGTSNAPDSLLVWTRAMNAVTLRDAFVGQGCEGKVAPQTAVSAGAGAMWIDLYHAVTADGGRYVQGGGCTDVGVAGLVQSGGFGSFSKGFGTAAAGLLEAEIVTADGEVRIANACMNPDLFWALKGGGGGSWGVVTRLTLKTHDLPEFFGAAWGKIRARDDKAFKKLIARFIEFYVASLFNPHWGEQVHFEPDNTFEISMVCQGLSSAETKAVWWPFFEWVGDNKDDYTVTDSFGAGAIPARGWWSLGKNPALTPDRRDGQPPYRAWWKGDQGQVGVFLHGYESLWLPAALLRDANRLSDALFAASRYKEVELHINKGLAGAPSDAIAAAKDTATNPAVVDAFALALIADGEAPAYPGQPGTKLDMPLANRDARLIDLAAAELRKVAPNSGSYVSESNYFNEKWQHEYWGENYPKLRAIKDKYDPTGLFFVHHGVGSEDWSADGFSKTV